MNVTAMIVGISEGLFALVAFIFFLRLIQAWLLHRTLREAIGRDSPVVDGLLDRIGRGDVYAQGSGSDDRIGMILVGIGLATLGYGLVAGEAGWVRHVIGASFFPLLVGAALLLRHRWAQRSTDRNLAPEA